MYISGDHYNIHRRQWNPPRRYSRWQSGKLSRNCLTSPQRLPSRAAPSLHDLLYKYSQGHGRGILPFSTRVSRGTGWSSASWELGKRKRESGMERSTDGLQGEFRNSSIELLRAIRDRKEAITSSLRRVRYCASPCVVIRSTHDDTAVRNGGNRIRDTLLRVDLRVSFLFTATAVATFFPPSPSVPLFSLFSSNCVLIGRDYDDNTSRRVG